MKIVIDMYGLGFKMHDLTEDQILMAVGRQPQYRERVYFWGDYDEIDPCKACAAVCDLDGVINIHCLNPENLYGKNLKPYFKKEVI